MIKKIFLKTGYKIWLVYTLLVVEYLLFACAPWLLGKTIDTVLAGQYYYFVLYGSCGVIGLIIGFVRRRLDTRIFANICLDITLNFLQKMFKSFNLCSSKIVVRIKKIDVFTQFAEYTIPSIVRSTIFICISFVCLFSAMGLWVLLIFSLMCLTLITSHYFSSKIEKVLEDAQLNDELKEKAIIDKNEEQTCYHCKSSTVLNIKFSDIQASNWGVVDICCIICELIAIYILTITVKPTTGEIMASLSYVHSLCGYFQVFPSVIEQLKQLKVASRFLYLKE